MSRLIASQEPKDRALFRAEALRCVTATGNGAALLAGPATFTVGAALVALFTAALIALLVFGSYTQRETVAGYIAVTNGELRIFPQTAGTVSGVLVTEGQFVTAGMTLFQLETGRNAGMSASANREILAAVIREKSALENQAQEQQNYFAAEARRLRQLLQGMDARNTVLGQQQRLANDKYLILQRDLARARQVHAQGHLAVRDLDALALAALDSELALLAAQLQQSDLAAERQEAVSRLEQLDSLQRTRLAEIAEAASRLAQRETAASAGISQQVIAPVDGHVSALHVTRGQTVLADTLALSLLPASAQYHAELIVPGRSIGMLKESARVQLRYDSYPYEKFGLYGATIERIAQSLLLPGDARLPVAVAEPVYRVRATLDQQYVEVDGARRALAAGISLQADILVSERSLLEWLLAPVIGAGRRF